MRILTIVPNLDVGGAQGSAQNASLAFLEEGHDVAVLAFEAGGVRVQRLRDAGAEVFVGGEAQREFVRAVDEAVAWRPDVLHVHRAGLADPTTGRIIQSIRASTSSRVAVIETNIFARVDASQSESVIDVHMLLTRYCLWKWKQWSRGRTPALIGAVAPNIVRSDGFYPAGDEARHAFRTAHGIPQDAVVFGRIGQPLRPKWSYAAFQAFAKFAAERSNAWFVAVGLPRSYPAFLATLPEDVRRRIVVIEFLHGEEALRACYAAMDVFLHSANIGESFGLVLAEAMLCERPVITLSTPLRDNSQLEVVGHERGGLVAANVNAMVEAMRKLADDPAWRDRLGKQGRAWCLEQYDSPHVGRIMLRIAELALQYEDRTQLAAALAKDPLIQTEVTDDEIHTWLARSIGKPSLFDRVGMWLVHQPLFYRFWSALRRTQRQLKGPGEKQRFREETHTKSHQSTASRE